MQRRGSIFLITENAESQSPKAPLTSLFISLLVSKFTDSQCTIPSAVPARFLKKTFQENKENDFFFSEDSTTIKVRTLGFLRLYNGNAQSERDGPFQN